MKKKLLYFIQKLNKKFYLLKKQISQSNVDFKTLNNNINKFNMLQKINMLYKKWKINEEELEITNCLLKDDNSSLFLNEELIKRDKIKQELEKDICLSLLPDNDNDMNNCLLEIHAGTGGTEASLFVETLFKMYQKYSYMNKWKTEIININYNNYKGYKEIIMKIIGQNVYGKLKFESGGHRVQRIPKTENQGRIHTSTCTVAVLPDLPEHKNIQLYNKDLRIDTFRSSGAGGQHVNTTDSAIRITHIPTGIVVECQNERSQHKNKNQALSILKAKINQLEFEKKQKELSKKKKNLLGTGDRSFRNRTYNYSQGRITDHRINFTIYELESVLNGKLDLLISPLIDYYNNELLKNMLNIKLDD